MGEAAGQVGSGGDLIPWLTGLLYDPRSFANFLRAGVFLIGELTSDLGPTAKYYWLGAAVRAGALVIKAGDRNPAPKG